MNPTDPTHTPSGVLFGAAYYAEYHREERTEADLDLMKAAGFTVIRVGESVWSTWEPRDGEFDLDWLQPVLDGAHERGIAVILGTPTYAVPPWLQTAYPEIAAERRTGERVPWGARQEVDYSHPAFRFHAERVIRAVIERYADHPAVIGYQVDNEPGMLLFHNRGSFQRFVRRLKAQYGDVETLNREWGLTYWSHRLSDWSDLWTPDGNTLPQYDLAWRRYQADLTTEFIAWQAGIVREYARPEQFVTTCIAYPRPAVADEELVEALDLTAGNPYYAMQDHLDALLELEPVTPWTSSGVAGLLRQADRLYSSKQSRFLVTETDAQSIGGSSFNLPPYPGQLKQAAFAFVSRGAAMIEYWHWHTLPYGTETYWGGVLPHSLEPGRVYGRGRRARRRAGRDRHDARRLRTRRGRRDPLVERQPLRPRVLPAARDPRRPARSRVVPAHRRRVPSRRRRRGRAVAHPARVAGALPGCGRTRGTVPGARRTRAVRRGRRRPRPPARLRGGGRSPHRRHPHGLRRRGGPGASRGRTCAAPRGRGRPVRRVLEPGPRGAGHRDRIPRGIRRERRTILGRRAHQHRRGDARPLRPPAVLRLPAVTTNAHGSGRITVVGTVPSPALAADLVRWAVPSPVADGLAADQRCPSPWHPVHCPTGDEPGSSSTGDGSRRRSRSRHPSPTPSLETTSRRAPMSHCRPGRRGPSSVSEHQGIV